MGIEEEERQATPPPWGWPPAQEENAHGVGEIVYDGSCNTNHQTKDRRHEQKEVYHKARGGAAPDGPPARNPRDRLEPVREPVRPDIAAPLRESPRHPVRDMAARVQARGGLAHRQAGEPLDIPRVRRGQGKGLHKRGQGQHGRPDEAHGGHGHPLQARGAGPQAVPVRREGHDQGGHAGQGRAMPEDLLQPHRGGRHGRVPRADAVPSRTAAETAGARARGEDGAGQEAAQGQAEGGGGGEGARALGDGHGRLGERGGRRAPRHARPVLQAMRHRARQAHQPGRGRQGHREDEGAQGPARRQERDDGQRLRVPEPEAARPRVQGRDLLHEGLRLLRERRRRELQPPRQEVVPEGDRLQPAHTAPGPAA